MQWMERIMYEQLEYDDRGDGDDAKVSNKGMSKTADLIVITMSEWEGKAISLITDLLSKMCEILEA